MKKFWIVILTAALLMSFVGCMKGGNADRGDDGVLGDDEDTSRSVIDDVQDGLDDAKDHIDDKIDDILPDDGPNVENGIVNGDNDINEGRRDRSATYDTPNGGVGNGYSNDNGNTANAGGGLNGSGATARNGDAVNGMEDGEVLPYGTIR